MSHQPRIVFICDFPPSAHRGGAILLRRLFAEYPADRVTVLAGSHYSGLAPSDGRLSCRQYVFPTTNKTGRWGLGRLKTLLDVLMLPILAIWGLTIVRRFHAEAIVSVAHDAFFLAAGALSCVTNLPLVLIVHDDWVATWSRNYRPLASLFRAVFGCVVRRAAHVYVVSPQMRDLLRSEFNVNAEFEFPSADPIDQRASRLDTVESSEVLHIAYAGTFTGAMDDSLGLLLRLVTGTRLRDLGISDWVVHLYTPAPPDGPIGQSPHVRWHGWVSPHELRAAMTAATVLYLPLSFRSDQSAITETSFPSKTAEYLATGTPILVCAPETCALTRYAREYGIAAIVSEPSEGALECSLLQLMRCGHLRARLRKNAQAAFARNHDVRIQRERFFNLMGTLTEPPGAIDHGSARATE